MASEQEGTSFFSNFTTKLWTLFGGNSEYAQICQPFKENYVRNCIKLNRIKTFKDMFLEEQVKPNDIVVPVSKHSILHETITLNKKDIFTLAVLYKADVNVKDARGITPLMKAAACGRTFMIKSLVENGADLYAKAPNGQSALDKAALYDKWEAYDLLKSYMDKNPQKAETEEKPAN